MTHIMVNLRRPKHMLCSIYSLSFRPVLCCKHLLATGWPFHRQGLHSVLHLDQMPVWCCTTWSPQHLKNARITYTIFSSSTALALINSTLNDTLHSPSAPSGAKHSITSEGQQYFSPLLNHKAGLNMKIACMLFAKTKYYCITKNSCWLRSSCWKESLPLQSKQTEGDSPLLD